MSGDAISHGEEHPQRNVTSTTGSVTTNPWQFAGGFYDNTTGLYKFGVRYYDPTLGRWTQQDPLGGSLFDPSTGNRYAYTNDDPTNLTDPTGKSATGCILDSIIGVAGLALSGIEYFAAYSAFTAAAVITSSIATGLLVASIGVVIAVAIADYAIQVCLGNA